MKKYALAILVLGNIAGSASAQSNVTIYGIIDAGLAREDNGAASVNRIDAGTQSGSRLGFKGTEDLGGGLSANFVIENGFATDTGSATQGGLLFGRETSVGLSGDFGAVKLGRFKTPIYMALDNLDPLNVGLGGGADRLFYNGTIAIRADNTIRYVTPNLSGLTGSAAYSFGETAGDASANRQVGLGLDYVKGPLDVRFAYHKKDTTVSVASGTNTKAMVLGGVYDFSVAKVHLIYGENKDDSNAGLSTSVKTRDFLVGVSVPFGASKVMATFARNKVIDKDDAASNQFALAYTYNLSKRTDLYTSYSRLTNDTTVKIKTVANGQTNTLFTAGIRHTF
jgi:predicted porin